MKAVGIMTFHRAENYGSVLQAYALNKYVNSLDEIQCEIIDYYPPKQKEIYEIFSHKIRLFEIVKNIIMLMNYKMLKNRKAGFKTFVNDNLNLSKQVYKNDNDLYLLDNIYSAIICGSDQIWNPAAVEYDSNFFLTKVRKADKIAYAPSICRGNLDGVNNKEEIIRSLLDFKALSIRENSGKNVLEAMLMNKRKVEVMIDPTLLLRKEDYDKICSPRIYDKEYIFFYSIDYNPKVVDMVKKISAYLKMPVVIIYTTAKTFKVAVNGFLISHKNSPGDFLSLIKNAKLVLSSSFHGTAFSIIYNKPFYSLYKTDENGDVCRDPRIYGILHKLKLKDRALDPKDLNVHKLSLDLDYDEANKLLEKEKEKAFNFLNSELKEK